MKFLSSLASCAALLWTIGAAPTPATWSKGNGVCYSRDYIQGIIDQEIVFLQHLNVTAAVAAGNAIFDPNIAEFGDSINSLRNQPLGTQVENGSATYIADTTSTPPIPQIDTLSLTIDCNQYVWQWRFYGIGQGPYAWINGFTLATLNAAGLVNYQYVEFNSLAWAANSGFNITPPTSGPYAPPTRR